jgi:sec-independent protein translocase protein TatB
VHVLRVTSPLESSLFDLSFFKIAVLAVLALVIFGPEQLPRMAVQAGRALRDFRRMADGARADLQQHLPEEFREFDLNDLNPKYFVRKHLMDEVNSISDLAKDPFTPPSATAAAGKATGSGIGTGMAAASGAPLAPGEAPPYDDEAT